jgi:lipopolysaccharide export system permease protein
MERIETFTRHNVFILNIIVYYFYKTPEVLIQLFPPCILFATVFSLGQMVRNKELIAIFSSGHSFYKFITPLIITGFILSIIMFIFAQIIMPPFANKADHMYNTFRNVTTGNSRFENNSNITKYGQNNILYHIGYFEYKKKTLNSIQIIKRADDNSIFYRLDARQAVFNAKTGFWTFYDIFIRHFDKNDNIIFSQKFNKKIIPIPEKPEYFLPSFQEMDKMSVKEAINHVNMLKLSGLRRNQELVELHFKFAMPFACLIIILLGAPLSAYSSKSVIVISFGLTILTGFLYYVFMDLGLSLGKNAVIPPFFAAWLGNIFFAGLSIYFLKNVHT